MKQYRIFPLCLGLAFGLTSAQTGLNGGLDGLHQQTANTFGQWNFTAGVGVSATSDSRVLSETGGYYDNNGKVVIQDRIAPMIAGDAFLGLGLTDFWDIGATLPLNYDGENPEPYGQHMRGSAIGDVDMWTKIKIPTPDGSIFRAALVADAYAPTGKSEVGMYPRHQWYIKSTDESTSAYTAGDWAFGGTLVLTFDFTQIDVPFRWNADAGYVQVLGDGTNTMTWATGLNVPTSAADFFLEASGEMRVEKVDGQHREPKADPMYLTPGMRLHLPLGMDLALGADLGMNGLFYADYDGEHTTPIIRKKNGETIRYSVTGPHYGLSALLSWNSGRIKDNDADKDGVPDKKDLCSHTPESFPVDTNGCPLDQDKDGIPDNLDKCPNTGKGLSVDSIGCTIDSDKDGVADGLDKCPNTPAGAAVNATGCPLDADNDGIADYKDKCPNTHKGATVDTLGCPTDADKDGVADELDKCPNTSMKATVDDSGCPLDQDKDGVPDYKDKCMNTARGVTVDTLGCPMDNDKDGVADYLDKCPGTPAGAVIDSTGCSKDTDKDGVEDVKDKCPNTPMGMTVDSTGCILDSDKDGVADVTDKCPNTQAGTTVDSTGCPVDADADGVPDPQDKCPGTLLGVKVKPNGCPVDKKQDLSQLKKGINFKPNSAILTNASYSTLDDIVALLREIPVAKLEVQGHTDSTGNEDKNVDLSQKRANTVVDYFVRKGIEVNRLRAIGYGSARPIADNKTKVGRNANRRVELVPFQ
jgi:outer membrane protein OmpA-like peptidoglycan-associated protein